MNLLKPSRRLQGIRMRAKDQSIICARTLEFNPETSPEIVFIPRGHEFTIIDTEREETVYAWRSRYAFAGIEGAERDMILEGVNEKGLSAGLFRWQGTVEPEDLPLQERRPETIIDLAKWALSNYATVKEVKQALPGLWVEKGAGVRLGQGYTPVYYAIQDRLGHHLVIGYMDGKLHLHVTPAKKFAGTPAFDWLMAQTSYISGTRQGVTAAPGVSPSCFVRVAARSLSTIPLNNAEEAVLQAFCILHSATGGKASQKVFRTCVNDLEHGRFFFYTVDQQQIRVVDLMKMDLEGGQMIHFSA